MGAHDARGARARLGGTPMSGRSKELVRLFTAPRRGRGGNEDEFRVSLDEFEPDDGNPSRYASIRIWWRGRDGEWLPGKAGITIRRGELAGVIAALQQASRILEGEESIPQPRRSLERTAEDMEAF